MFLWGIDLRRCTSEKGIELLAMLELAALGRDELIDRPDNRRCGCQLSRRAVQIREAVLIEGSYVGMNRT